MQAISDTRALVGAYLRERAGLCRALEACVSPEGRARLQSRIDGVDAALRELGHPVDAPQPVEPPKRTAAPRKKPSQTRA